MRLTRFNKLTKEYEYHLNNPNTSMIQDEIAGIQKLGQLEDIEEELGIDLTVLLKNIHNPIDFIRKFRVGAVWHNRNGKLAKYDLYNLFEKGDKITLSAGDGYVFFDKVSNYGKTWALTKEELEK